MKRTDLALLTGIGATGALVGWLELFRRSRQSRCLVLRETLPGAPEELFERLIDVEAEPTLIPGVDAVTVLERDERSVRYRVEGRVLGTSWWVVFRKDWEGAPHTLTWESEDGTADIRQLGQVDLQPTERGTFVTLVACTHFNAPILGPIATLTAGPLYLKSAFHAWLRNIGRATSTRRHWEHLLGERVRG
jgi:hypothetical protein